ncbi:hypothetical protein IWW38_000758 [Coemansia aciculifera]|uniref:Uncharacterized protein n=1 Tax=Coemansia aciculifera TaxID=417176 RepID=A0ACC1M925_9FUNG|nr:hypothetical protein IWW38_000758 [Coemansia aciculifera]
MLDFVSPPGALGLIALAMVGYYACRRYIAGCRIQLIVADAKTSAVVRHTTDEGLITLRDVLYAECPALTDPRQAFMVPTPYLPTGLLQTIYATMRVRLYDRTSDIAYERNVFVMPDAATVSLDWYPSIKGDGNGPIALLLSGVGGSSQEHHIRAMAKSLVARFGATSGGFRVVVVNHRGTAGTPITSARPYDSGFTDDLRTIVRHVRLANPLSKLVGIGFSMGANVLTKYIGEESSACPLSCAIAVCCPFDIKVSSDAINQSNILNNYVFQPAVMRTLMRAIKRAEHVTADPAWALDMDRINSAKRLWEIEEELMVKISGYKNLAEYYERSGSVSHVDSITIPFLAINTLDDRITPPHGIPVAKFTVNPSIALALVPHGGHLGFLTGISPRIWFINPIEQFVAAIIR